MTTLSERSSTVLGHIINQEQAGLELQAASRMNIFLANVEGLVGDLQALADCRNYLSGEGLEMGAPSRKRSQDASKARTTLRSSATRLERSDLSAEDLIHFVDGETARAALDAVVSLRDALLTLISTCLDAERERLVPDEARDDLPDVPGETLLVHQLERAKAVLTSPVSVTAGDIRAGCDAVRAQLVSLREKAEVWRSGHPKLAAALAAASPEMQAFIRAASTEDGAPLGLLTDAVRSELEAADQLDGYRVRAR